MSSIVKINGKTYTTDGNGDLTISNNQLFIDGKLVMDDGEIQKLPKIEITIVGDIKSIKVPAATYIDVTGRVGDLETTTGNVTVSENVEGDIETTSGDIKILGDVLGSCKTMSGDIEASDIGGNCKTMSGNISKIFR